MAQTPEGKVKAGIKKFLDSIGAYWTMPATGGFGASGAPDFIGVYRGRGFGIEAKRPGGKPTPLQLDHLERIKQAGGIACICTDANVLASFFREALT